MCLYLYLYFCIFEGPPRENCHDDGWADHSAQLYYYFRLYLCLYFSVRICICICMLIFLREHCHDDGWADQFDRSKTQMTAQRTACICAAFALHLGHICIVLELYLYRILNCICVVYVL